MGLWMLLQTALKKVQGRVIPAVKHVLDILFQGYFEFSSAVCFTYFEPTLAEPFKQLVEFPVVEAWPLLSYVLYDDRLRSKFVPI